MKYDNCKSMGVLRAEILKPHNMFGFDLRLFLSSCDRGSTERVAAVAEPIVFKKYKRGDVAGTCLHFDVEDMQGLMNALWSVGVRPSNGEGNVGQIGAMREHLADIKEDKKFYQQLITKAANQEEKVQDEKK